MGFGGSTFTVTCSWKCGAETEVGSRGPWLWLEAFSVLTVQFLIEKRDEQLIVLVDNRMKTKFRLCKQQNQKEGSLLSGQGKRARAMVVCRMYQWIHNDDWAHQIRIFPKHKRLINHDE